MPNGIYKPREPRQKVLISARMRVGGNYSDVCIRNISPRGMMLQAASPPPVGSYVEILRAAHTVVARVVWINERRFGIHTSDRLNIPAIINETVPTGQRNSGQERRSPDRPRAVAPSMSDIALQAERSRRLSGMVQFGLLGLSGMVGAAMLGSLAYTALASPFQRAAAHLSQTG